MTALRGNTSYSDLLEHDTVYLVLEHDTLYLLNE